MAEELVPAPVDTKAAGRDFWKRYHEFRRIRHSELRPDDPLEPDEVVEAQMKKPNPFDFNFYFEISESGVMLSFFDGETVTPANPEYTTNKHLFWANAYVRPARRRPAIGATWLPVMAKLMAAHGCTVAVLHADQDAGHGVLQARGAQSTLTDI